MMLIYYYLGFGLFNFLFGIILQYYNKQEVTIKDLIKASLFFFTSAAGSFFILVYLAIFAEDWEISKKIRNRNR